MRILLVEDDLQLAQGLQKSLRLQGFAVDHVLEGGEALHVVRTGECDMLILDLGLPDMDGTQVLQQVRKAREQLPVLVLTARESVEDKIQGLDLGADDYLVKPFQPAELFARLRVIERRLGTVNSSIIQIGDVCLDMAAHQVQCTGNSIKTSRKEYMVLKALMENAGRIQSRQQLETKLYEWGEEVASNVIEVHVHNLRKKLPDKFIQTIRGVGYCIDKT